MYSLYRQRDDHDGGAQREENAAQRDEFNAQRDNGPSNIAAASTSRHPGHSRNSSTDLRSSYNYCMSKCVPFPAPARIPAFMFVRFDQLFQRGMHRLTRAPHPSIYGTRAIRPLISTKSSATTSAWCSIRTSSPASVTRCACKSSKPTTIGYRPRIRTLSPAIA